MNSHFTLDELKQHIRPLGPVLSLERALSSKARKRLRVMCVYLAVVLLLMWFVGIAFPSIASGFFGNNALRFGGVLFIVMALWLKFFSLESYVMTQLTKSDRDPRLPNFEAAQVIDLLDPEDTTEGFLNSNQGMMVMGRLGLGKKAVSEITSREGRKIEPLKAEANNSGVVTLVSLASAVFDADKSFADYLFSKGIQKEDLLGATRWVAAGQLSHRRDLRWWRKDRLLSGRGIGEGWSYGETFTLKRYAAEIAPAGLSMEEPYHKKEEDALETILYRSEEANALLVGDDETDRIEVLSVLAERIVEGNVAGPLKRKKLYLLDGDALVGATGNKQHFEVTFNKVLSEAARAGHVVLVVDKAVSFMKSASALGAEVVPLMSPYFNSPELQIIMLASMDEYHRFFETNPSVSQHFEVVTLKEGSGEALMKMIMHRAEEVEATHGVFFTYQAVKAIATSSERYFTGLSLSDTVRDLLIELAPWVAKKGSRNVRAKDVLEIVEAKTGIPTGEVKQEERTKLLNLENELHARVIGQEEAIKAISEVMRRSRSGLQNPKRPIGSFLFLGPTGVGKTETTKALAAAFFGGDDKMMRLDMSEYSGPEAVRKLIGSFDTGETGTLATLLREKPYGVLLLDEFEKANDDVHNLFLQILDEGNFSDMHGKSVNARNLIIIATSNAGSDLIWAAVKDGKNPSDAKDEIISKLIEGRSFRPELLNRFDGTIVFHPLGEEHLRKIARLMLNRFDERLREKGVKLEVTDDLIDHLISIGMDPTFGARPMWRAIASDVEEPIAKALLSGEVSKGSTIKLVKAEGSLSVVLA